MSSLWPKPGFCFKVLRHTAVVGTSRAWRCPVSWVCSWQVSQGEGQQLCMGSQQASVPWHMKTLALLLLQRQGRVAGRGQGDAQMHWLCPLAHAQQGLASNFQDCSRLHAYVHTHVCAGMCGAQTCFLGHAKHVHTHHIPLCSASAAVCTRTPAWTNTPMLNVFANPAVLAHPVHTRLLQPESQPERVYLASVHSQIHKYTH